MYYSSFGLLALIVHIIINFEAMKRPHARGDIEIRNRYRMFLFSVLIYYIIDSSWGFFDSLKIVPLSYTSTVLFFTSMAVTVLLWMRLIVAFLGKDGFSKVVSVAGWGIFGFGIITIIINFFIPIMFLYDSEKNYVPGVARYFLLGLQILMFIALTIYTMIRSFIVAGQVRLHHRAVGVSGSVMIFFIILQTIYPNLPFYAIGCLIATCIIHTFVEVDEKVYYNQELGSVKQIAYKDTLTNVRNKNAFNEMKSSYDEKIWNKTIREFGLIIFDLNDLKKVNDTMGHEAGDRYIKEASKMICEAFKHSPVFRIGGDEFVVLLEGEDYRNRGFLLRIFNEKVEGNQKFGGPVVSAGMDIFHLDTDLRVDEVFQRADALMYERKKELKSRVF